jgi:3-hydroxypropanoate dehydrogenase
MPFYNIALRSSQLARVISDCYQFIGRSKTISLLDDMNQLGFREATRSGLSFATDDLITPEAKGRLVSHMNEGNQAKTAAAPVTAVLAVDTDFHEYVPEVFPINPALKDVLADAPEMRDGMGRFSAGLQIGYFLLAVRAEGLVAGPMAGFDGEAIDKEFFPDGRFKSLLVVNIGHPGENPWFPRLPRLPHDNTLVWA